MQMSGGEVDVAKEQLGVLVKIQHDLKRQQVIQQASLTSQFLLGKMQETMAKLLTERSKDFERQRKEMMLYMEKESNLHQNSMDQIENVVEKVGTTLEQFTASLTTLSATIKDLSADQRTQGRDHLDTLGRIHYEIQGTKELIGHVRSNTLSTSKEIKALIWQVGELRSGSTPLRYWLFGHSSPWSPSNISRSYRCWIAPLCRGSSGTWAVKKRGPGCLGQIGDYIPHDVGFMINHCKDHYYSGTMIQWKVRGWFFAAQMNHLIMESLIDFVPSIEFQAHQRFVTQKHEGWWTGININRYPTLCS